VQNHCQRELGSESTAVDQRLADEQERLVEAAVFGVRGIFAEKLADFRSKRRQLGILRAVGCRTEKEPVDQGREDYSEQQIEGENG
jgi:hypothetical protein